MKEDGGGSFGARIGSRDEGAAPREDRKGAGGVDHLARCCAFRASAGVAKGAETAELEAMVRHDSEVLLGRAIEWDLEGACRVLGAARAARAGATPQGEESARWERERDRWIEAVAQRAA